VDTPPRSRGTLTKLWPTYVVHSFDGPASGVPPLPPVAGGFGHNGGLLPPGILEQWSRKSPYISYSITLIFSVQGWLS
jgi:hypothetical protein